jgi:tetratricopeptide (TPR) repeat protein
MKKLSIIFVGILLLGWFVFTSLASRPQPTTPSQAALVLETIHAREQTRQSQSKKPQKELSDEQIQARLEKYKAALIGNPSPASTESMIHFALEHDPAGAAAECEKIIAADPNNTYALYHGSIAYLGLGEPAKSSLLAARSLKIRDSSESRLVLAQAFAQQGKKTLAMKQVEEVLKREPRLKSALELKEMLLPPAPDNEETKPANQAQGNPS